MPKPEATNPLECSTNPYCVLQALHDRMNLAVIDWQRATHYTREAVADALQKRREENAVLWEQANNDAHRALAERSQHFAAFLHVQHGPELVPEDLTWEVAYRLWELIQAREQRTVQPGRSVPQAA